MNTPSRTIAEAVDQLQNWLSTDQISTFVAKSEEDLADYHFGLGLRIRNEFGLWDPQSSLLQDYQASEGTSGGPFLPDEASMLILHALWRHLRH